jgi:3-methyladenine DNA glycosylase AlkD
MQAREIIEKIKSVSKPANIEGMARFGISTDNCYGLSAADIYGIAKGIGKNHELALELWDTGVHEARILAPLIDLPKLVSEEQMEHWVSQFNSWDICDCCCGRLFDKTQFAYQKAFEWSERGEEFVKRAGFVMMAVLAVHDKKAPDDNFEQFYPIILREATDERNFVRKAVNWALRQIGKRNFSLNESALQVCEELLNMYPKSKSARWIARDAAREFKSATTKRILDRREMRRV